MKNYVMPLVLVSLFLLPANSLTQKASADQMGKFANNNDFATLHMRTKLGSVKSIDGKGRFDISFEGTLLVTQLNGEIKMDGKFRKEFERNNRVVYTGKGRAIVEGEWRGIQFFGNDMECVWYGSGAAHITAEFTEHPVTKKLYTGDYWYDNPDQKQAFPNANVQTIFVPNPFRKVGEGLVPTPRKKK